jgi:hypothetical protein
VQTATALVMMAFLAPDACAHSWYPTECCSGKDCTVADGLIRTPAGDLEVIVGAARVFVPRTFAVRPSPDGHIHVCFTVDETRIPIPVCLFLPSGA